MLTLTVLSADVGCNQMMVTGRKPSGLQDELKSHFLAAAYSMARTLPS